MFAKVLQGLIVGKIVTDVSGYLCVFLLTFLLDRQFMAPPALTKLDACFYGCGGQAEADLTKESNVALQRYQKCIEEGIHAESF